jgi:hypothetical protein
MQLSFSTWKSQLETGKDRSAPNIKERQAYLYNFFKILGIFAKN